MRLELWRPIAVVLVLLGTPGAIRGEAADDAGTSLVDVAKVSGCKGEPAGYVSGYFSSDDRLSGVFWCTRDPDAESDRFLISWLTDIYQPTALRCPSVLRSINWPQQLKILRDARIRITPRRRTARSRSAARSPIAGAEQRDNFGMQPTAFGRG